MHLAEKILPSHPLNHGEDYQTIEGDEFRLWHEAQMLTVLAVHEALMTRGAIV